MKRCQHTLGKEVSFSGIGVHTGEEVTIKFLPAKENTGVRFQRVDLPDQPVIPAIIDHVHSTSRSTNIGIGDAKVYTVEHVLASLYAYSIDNVLIQLNASEPPIGDGSSTVFVDMIEEAGLKAQNAFQDVVVIKEPIHWSEDGISIVALPSDEYRISYVLSYSSVAALRSQYASITIDKDSFRDEIASCRTFVLYHEVASLMDRELIKGGSLENAVVIDDEAIFSKEGLKFPNEMARHKVLDLIGDLSLIGRRLQAHIIAVRSGHTSNYAFAKKIVSSHKRGERKMTTSIAAQDLQQIFIKDIMEMLPHRYPFLLIDKVVEIDLEKNTIVGQKNVTINEPFFQGHFPGAPIMPGVLVLEALAQTGGILICQKGFQKGYEHKWAVLLSLNHVKFRYPVSPGDVLTLHAEINHLSTKGGRMTAKAMVGDKLAAEAEIGYALREPDQI